MPISPQLTQYFIRRLFWLALPRTEHALKSYAGCFLLLLSGQDTRSQWRVFAMRT